MSEEPEARLLPLLARTVLAGPEGNEFRVPRPEEAHRYYSSVTS